jgi:hypothetical protein
MTEQQKATTADELVEFARTLIGEGDVDERARRYLYLRGIEDRLRATPQPSPQRDEESTAQEAAPVAFIDNEKHELHFLADGAADFLRGHDGFTLLVPESPPAAAGWGNDAMTTERTPRDAAALRAYLMDAQTVRLQMGELTAKELRLAQGAIGWALNEYDDRLHTLSQRNEEIGQFPPLKAFTRSALIEELQVRDSRKTTHWDGCWKEPQHHACAVGLIERLTASPPAAPVADGTEGQRQPWEKFDDDIEEHTSPVTDPAVLRAIGEGLKGAATDTPASAVAEPVSDKEIYWLGQAIEAAYQNGSNTLGDELDALRDKLHSAAPPPIARSDADEDLRSLAAQRTHERDEERARVGRILGLVDAALCAVDSLPQSEERDDARKKLRAMFDAGKYTARSDADDGKSIADAFEDAWDGKLHPDTRYLVAAFANALAEKLAAAEEKYGYTNGWADKGWMDECRAQLIEHVVKGDPRDVAAYCAFLWYHGERTAVDAAPVAQEVSEAMVRHMVNRFLGWRLPKTFSPDNGISYTRPNYAHPPADHDWPVGTNLFNAAEVEAMVRYMLGGFGSPQQAAIATKPAHTASAVAEPDFERIALSIVQPFAACFLSPQKSVELMVSIVTAMRAAPSVAREAVSEALRDVYEAARTLLRCEADPDKDIRLAARDRLDNAIERVKEIAADQGDPAAPPFDTRSPCGDPNVTVAARDAVTGEPTMFVRAKGGGE